MSKTNTVELIRPDLAAEWDLELNGGLTPSEVVCGSHKKVWRRCSSGHEWQASVKSRVEGCSCPVCQNRRVVAGVNDFASKYPLLVLQWHPTKNLPMAPENVFPGSTKRYWWKCEKGHEWRAGVASRASGAGCPYCTGRKVEKDFNDLNALYPQIAAQWDAGKNGSLSPTDVTPYANKKVWWKCNEGHSWQAVIASRTSENSGCPYCAGKKVMKGYNDLKTKYPKVAAEWHPTLNGNLLPEMVSPGSHKKVWWQCSAGHEWRAMVYSRTGSHSCGCPVCAGKRKEGTTVNVYLAERRTEMPDLSDRYKELISG